MSGPSPTSKPLSAPAPIPAEAEPDKSPSAKDPEKAKGKDAAKVEKEAKGDAKDDAAGVRERKGEGPRSAHPDASRTPRRPGGSAAEHGESHFVPKQDHLPDQKLPPQLGKQTHFSHLQFANPRPAAGGPQARPGPEGKHPHGGPRPGPGAPLPDRPHVGPRRPLPPEPSREAYHAILREPVFQGPLRGSPLFQKMQAQAMREAMIARQGVPQRQVEQVLTRGEVVQLFRQRNQAEKREEFRAVLRHELTKARQEARQKVQALQQHNESLGEGGDTAEALQRLRGPLLDTALREKLAHKLRGQNRDSVFEQVLQQVLDGKKSVPDLPVNVRARFAAKSEGEWRAFFTQVMGMSSVAVESSLKLTGLIEALFRGVFKAAEDGTLQLVSDFTHAQAGETVENKFSRLTVDNPEIASRLQTLVPGDVIAQEILKLIGEDAKFLRLEHVPQGVVVPTEQQKQEALAEMRSSRSRDAQRKLEDALLASRRNKEDEDDDESRYPGPFPPPHTPLRDRPFGHPRGMMYLFYAVGSALVMILIYLLLTSR